MRSAILTYAGFFFVCTWAWQIASPYNECIGFRESPRLAHIPELRKKHVENGLSETVTLGWPISNNWPALRIRHTILHHHGSHLQTRLIHQRSIPVPWFPALVSAVLHSTSRIVRPKQNSAHALPAHRKGTYLGLDGKGERQWAHIHLKILCHLVPSWVWSCSWGKEVREWLMTVKQGRRWVVEYTLEFRMLVAQSSWNEPKSETPAEQERKRWEGLWFYCKGSDHTIAQCATLSAIKGLVPHSSPLWWVQIHLSLFLLLSSKLRSCTWTIPLCFQQWSTLAQLLILCPCHCSQTSAPILIVHLKQPSLHQHHRWKPDRGKDDMAVHPACQHAHQQPAS